MVNQRPGLVKAPGLSELVGGVKVPCRWPESICLFTLHSFTSHHSSLCLTPVICFLQAWDVLSIGKWTLRREVQVLDLHSPCSPPEYALNSTNPP